MEPQPRTPRPGFTLVELLMVIIIIGILAGLLIVAVGPTLGTVNNAVVKTEIDQLDLALNNYRDTYGAIPPTMYPFGSATTGAIANDRFERHTRKAFARYRGDFAASRGTLLTGTALPVGATYGGLTGCNLNTMDAAEALVFWLGGIPKIWKADTNTGEFEVELTGFSKDPSNPFLPEYDLPAGGGTAGVDFQPERTPPLFEFDPQRLIDADKDGWPEYVPDLGSAAQQTPPFVYFDAASYTDIPFYPPVSHPANASSNNWGLAHPYLIRYTPNSSDAEEIPLPSNFANEATFQIISSGADLKFGQLAGSALPAVQAAADQMTILPEGEYYTRKSGDPNDPADRKPIEPEDFDNLTNFADSTLENEIED